MSFGHPLLLLSLLLLPIAALVYLWLERRPAKYAMTFTNMDVLASVAGGRSVRRSSRPRWRCSRSLRSASRSPARTAPPWSLPTAPPSSS